MKADDVKYIVTLEYKGVRYSYEEDEGIRDAAGGFFIYEEGNYACDCNRSLFIGRYCDESFPEMECGETIKLVSIEEKE